MGNINKRLATLEQEVKPKGGLIVAVDFGDGTGPKINGVPTTQAALDELEAAGNEVLVIRVIRSDAQP